MFANVPHEFQSAQMRHLQIGNNEIEIVLLEETDRFSSVARQCQFMTDIAEQHAEQSAQLFLIFGNQ